MLEIEENRRSRKLSGKTLFYRLAWAMFQPVFLYTPRQFWALRRLIIILFGGKVDRNVRIESNVRILYPWFLEVGEYTAIARDVIIYNVGQVSIGKRATISHRAHICSGTHNYNDPALALEKRPVCIENDTWLCADTFIAPGVTIGRGAVIGARAVIRRDVSENQVVIGNPQILIGTRRFHEREK